MKNGTKELLICIDKKVAVIQSNVTNMKDQVDEQHQDIKTIMEKLDKGTGKIATVRESVNRVWWVISGVILVLLAKVILG